MKLGDFNKIGVVTVSRLFVPCSPFRKSQLTIETLQTVKESSSMSSFNVKQQDKHTSDDKDGRVSVMSFGTQRNSMDELVQKWNIK